MRAPDNRVNRTARGSFPTVSTHQVRTSSIRCVLIVGILVGIDDYAIGVGLFVAALGQSLLAILQQARHIRRTAIRPALCALTTSN